MERESVDVGCRAEKKTGRRIRVKWTYKIMQPTNRFPRTDIMMMLSMMQS